MSEAADIAIIEPPIQEAPPKANFFVVLKQIYQLVSPYWRSEEKVYAWTMLVATMSVYLLSIYNAVLLNKWNANFYNALQTLDKANFSKLLFQFFYLVMAAVAIFVTARFMEMFLAFRWRIWMTKQVMGDWLHNSTFCKLFTYNTKTENPDQRISQDMANFTSSTLELSFKLVTECIKSFTFAIILWNLSVNLLMPLPGGKQIAVPGYMLWFTIIYVSISTFIIFKTGNPLVKLDYEQEKVEADFRFNLMRIRERRDEVSLLEGSKAETIFLDKNLGSIIENMKRIIYRNIYVNGFQNIFANMSTIIPILAAAPMFFTGAITLGILMQMASAFNNVGDALMYIALRFQLFASWKATFDRIVDFKAEIATLNNKIATENTELQLNLSSQTKALEIDNLTIHLPHKMNFANFNFHVQPEEKLLIMGRSGMGKSTLLKCIAGHWPFASGTVNRPFDLMIVPQKPYYPISTLRNCLLYPNLDRVISNQELKRVLTICSLEHLCDKLEETNDWLSILSLGEQQRLNFARVIIARPSWLILDEPTASMDKALEAKLFAVLFRELPTLSLLTIGHAITLKEMHNRCIEL